MSELPGVPWSEDVGVKAFDVWRSSSGGYTITVVPNMGITSMNLLRCMYLIERDGKPVNTAADAAERKD